MRKVLIAFVILLLSAITTVAQSEPRAEVFAGYSFLSADAQDFIGQRKGFHGVGFSVAGDFGPHFGLVGDFSYNHANYFGTGVNAATYVFGPRVSLRGKSATGFAHVLFGGTWLRVPGASDTGFTMAIGGGVDLNAGRHFAVRLAQVDYLPSHLGGRRSHSVRYEGGIVFKIGGK